MEYLSIFHIDIKRVQSWLKFDVRPTATVLYILAILTIAHIQVLYTVFQKSDAKIQITTAHLNRINYPLSSFNYRLFGTNVVNFNKIHHMVSEQQPFKKWNLKTEFSNMENTNWKISLLQEVLRIMI